MKNFKMVLLVMVLVVIFVLFVVCFNKEEEKKVDVKIEECIVKYVKGEIKIFVNLKKIVDFSGLIEELLIFGMKLVIIVNIF